jgi:hypothetical protein
MFNCSRSSKKAANQRDQMKAAQTRVSSYNLPAFPNPTRAGCAVADGATVANPAPIPAPLRLERILGANPQPKPAPFARHATPIQAPVRYPQNKGGDALLAVRSGGQPDRLIF